MADSTEYKCPACGSALAFDPESGKLSCTSCGNHYEPDAIKSLHAAQGENSFVWGDSEEIPIETEYMENTKVYVCESCGAQIETDPTTAATRCPYCGNNVTLDERISGGLKPNAIIPFKITPKMLPLLMQKFYSKKILLPSHFFDDNEVGKVQGVYVPFWLFSAKISGTMQFRAERVRVYRSGQYDCTETSHFLLERDGSVAFLKVPVDASVKMDNDLMDSIEPFDYTELTDFESGYLAGFLADRFDSGVEDEIGRATGRMIKSTGDVFLTTTRGYTSVRVVGNDLKAEDIDVKYVMLPVYLLNCEYKGKKYRYAVNGQTGKVVGELPVSKLKSLCWYLGAFGVGLAVVMALMLLL